MLISWAASWNRKLAHDSRPPDAFATVNGGVQRMERCGWSSQRGCSISSSPPSPPSVQTTQRCVNWLLGSWRGPQLPTVNAADCGQHRHTDSMAKKAKAGKMKTHLWGPFFPISQQKRDNKRITCAHCLRSYFMTMTMIIKALLLYIPVIRKKKLHNCLALGFTN